MDVQNSVIQWLLEDDNPSVQFRTLKEVLDYDDNSSEVLQAKAAILQSQPVQTLLVKMHPDGYWLQKNPRTQISVGDGVEYDAFATTHFCLAYLAELRLDRTHPLVEKAANRYFALQQADGDWYRHLSCLLGYNIRTFALLGYREDYRLKRALDLLANIDRKDGGYLCDMHEGKRKTVKSCIRGSVKALLAFAEFPDYWDHPRCKQLADYFLRRGGIYKSAHPGIPVNQDMQRLSFPITWGANEYEVLYALSKMEHGNDERLRTAWADLENKADPAGRFYLDWTPTQCPWKVGKRSEVNKWITFYVVAARKYKTRKIQ
jgi:hypothetical protein